MPLLHDKIWTARRIMKGDYVMTRERAKDLYMELRYVPKEMIHNDIVFPFFTSLTINLVFVFLLLLILLYSEEYYFLLSVTMKRVEMVEDNG